MYYVNDISLDGRRWKSDVLFNVYNMYVSKQYNQIFIQTVHHLSLKNHRGRIRVVIYALYVYF